MGISILKNEPNFSIVLGGPLFQLLMRLRLMTPNLGLLIKRIIVITLLAYLPLFILSIVEHHAWGDVGLPFLYDFEAQFRFLLALPLLIAAELFVHEQLRPLIKQFTDRDIIIPNELPKFKEGIATAVKMRNSVTVEVILLLLVFVGGHYLWNTLSILESLTSGIGSWYGAGNHLSLAGNWYNYVSRPIFHFIALRWYYRIFIWTFFLWKTSRLKLNLVPTHPDRCCGLGFLSMTSNMFGALILAHGVLMAGLIANAIFFGGARIDDFVFLVLSVVLFVALIIIGPLLVFVQKIMLAKRKGICEYGTLASEYIEEFDQKWLRGKAPADEAFIGSSDIQALADLSSSFQVVRNIRSVPVDKDTIIQILAFTLIPVLPLIFTLIPMNKIIAKLFSVVF